MTDTDTATAAAPADLASLKIPELRKIAADKGLKGVSGLRKSDLITAIQTGAVQPRSRAAAPAEQAAPVATPESVEREEKAEKTAPARRTRETAQEQAAPAEASAEATETAQEGGSEEPRYESRSAARRARRNRARHGQRDQEPGQDQQEQNQQHSQDSTAAQEQPRQERTQEQEQPQDSGQDQQEQGQQQRGQREQREQRSQRGQRGDQREQREQRSDNGDGEGRRGRRNRRNRRGRAGDQHDGGQQQHQDQQQDSSDLHDVAGILDIVDSNVAFVRTTGYHASPADVFVPNQLIRRSGLRAGDAVTGKVRMGGGQTHGQGRNRQKYNQLVSVDTANGLSLDEARNRPDFAKLTPLYPNQRLRLETDPKILTTRVIDLIMPIGKGQRALIVSPPKAGKTTILQNIANAISTNNPECYLMVVLVDERPEEVTDMQRSVNGEVIASTFDRPPGEHTAVAELAIERAKRLVEQGKDVVVLLDSITRLGRAYNNSSPASGRILSGGVDSNALYPPKRFLGAARNIENGGSLTIVATAMVETGSAGDTVIFEEFKGTGNAELKLDRKISERRVFPAVDVNPSGTRKDELLLAPDEARVMHKLRRILSALDPQQAIDLLIRQLKKTKSNGEFLLQVASSAPMAADKDEEDYS
ncbi:transcription termination factor Rho [Corynebacterium hylobatis]|uniref:Transcription termination factor Rho n=1 Tax=Corynebacterium hylobatis TaxID=1859290 RepID=A0A3S0A1K3_9CORY|nr:transcription termination factor Rho [Corynebacterium hylobatis]RSZ66169.1 transcription termination factor Rho [Corynebacterium hylobatis]